MAPLWNTLGCTRPSVSRLPFSHQTNSLKVTYVPLIYDSADLAVIEVCITRKPAGIRTSLSACTLAKELLFGKHGKQVVHIYSLL